MNLLQGSTKKLFLKYLLPSICATLVTSIYVLADTIMIGQGVGASGMAALNIILPLFSLFFGTGLLLGVGGAVLMAVAKGGGDQKLAHCYFTHAVILGMIISMFYILVGQLFLEQIGYLLGCDDNTIGFFMSYCRIFVGFAPAFVFSSLLQAFVRNDEAPKRAMVAVISGGVINIVLDYVFIFILKMGMAGGAIATVIGSVTSVSILLTHFISPHHTMKLVKEPIQLEIIVKMLHSGLPSFIIEIATGIVVMVFNIQILKLVGEPGVVVYSIIANSAIVAMSLFNGVSQGAQPIMAINYGAKQFERVKEVRRLGAITAFIISIFVFLAGFLFPETAVGIFTEPTYEIVEMARGGIRIYFTAFLMMSFNIFYSTYFQSILQPKISMIICLLRGLILCLILVVVLPSFMGITGIWLVMPITEMLTVIVASLLVNKVKI